MPVSSRLSLRSPAPSVKPRASTTHVSDSCQVRAGRPLADIPPFRGTHFFPSPDATLWDTAEKFGLAAAAPTAGSGKYSGACAILVAMKPIRQHPENDEGLALQEAKPKVRRPPLYKVILLNDDYTPMDFVVYVLQKFFGMDQEKATQVMLQVHTKGMGVCGIFNRDIAETKVALVNQFAREHQHPLKCTMEKV